MLGWCVGSAVWTGMVTMKDRVAESLPDHFATPLISKEAAASGQWIPRRNDRRYPIPGQLNIFLTCAQMLAALTILAAASHTKTSTC